MKSHTVFVVKFETLILQCVVPAFSLSRLQSSNRRSLILFTALYYRDTQTFSKPVHIPSSTVVCEGTFNYISYNGSSIIPMPTTAYSSQLRVGL